jgi:hypothetical protein
LLPPAANDPLCTGAGLRLPLVGGGFTLVDPAVGARLTRVSLYRNRLGYVVFYEGRRRLQSLHRWITQAPPGRDVHHCNSERADNRAANLAVVTRSIHWLLAPAHGSWPFGVSPSRGRWDAAWTYGSRKHHVGRFASRYLAALARDDALASALPGVPFQRNFPRTIRAPRLARALRRTGGRAFRVVFVRRANGGVREMTCRLPLPLEVAARPPRVDARRAHVVSVIDVECNEYRFIPLENVLCFEKNGVWHRIDRRRGARRQRGSTASGTSSAPTAASTV